jgi:hypothetical protein
MRQFNLDTPRARRNSAPKTEDEEKAPIGQ